MRAQKKTLGTALTPGKWVEPDLRDSLVAWCDHWAAVCERGPSSMAAGLGITSTRLSDWRERLGQANKHNAAQPRHTWVSEDNKREIIDFYLEHPEDGYRRCAYMMLDADLVAVCPATVYNVLKKAGVLRGRRLKKSKKGSGFVQPLGLHEQWHTDITYIRIGTKYYYLISFLDGFSRMIVHSELREAMTDLDVNIVFQKALDACPEAEKAKVRVISDNGSQFTGKEFHNMITAYGLNHIKTSPHYPQSNGKIERWHKTLKIEIKPKHLDSMAHAQEIVDAFIKHYNEVRLHSALGYITPKDMAEGRQAAIHAERDRKLAAARQTRGWTHVKRSKSPKSQNLESNPPKPPVTSIKDLSIGFGSGIPAVKNAAADEPVGKSVPKTLPPS